MKHGKIYELTGKNFIKSTYLEDILKLTKIILNKAKGKQLDLNDRILYGNGLALRVYRNACSIRQLVDGTKVLGTSKNSRFYDDAAIELLARGILESYLIFNWLYVQPKNEAEKEFRFKSYILGSLLERKLFVDRTSLSIAWTEEIKKQIEKEQLEINKVKEEMKLNKFYLKNKDNRNLKIKSLIEDGICIGRGPFKIPELMELANFNLWKEKEVYMLISHGAHSNYFPLRQSILAEEKQKKLDLCRTSINLAAFCLARICEEYEYVFPEAKFEPKSKRDIELFNQCKWLNIASKIDQKKSE